LFRSDPAPRPIGRRDWFAYGCKIFAAVWAVILLYPILFILAMSVSNGNEVNNLPAWLVPAHVVWDNYVQVFNFFAGVVPIPTLLGNSAIVTSSAIVGTMVIAVLVSYAFATMSFPGKRIVFYTILLGLIVPIPAMLIPEFITVKTYGLIGTRFSLILPYIAFGLPLPTLILTAFFKELPKELYEAAAIDGTPRWKVLWRIVLPLARPALGTCVIYLGLQFWNEFSLALVVIQNPALTTVPLGLASVQGHGISPWQLVAAGVVVTSLPIVILFLVFQRQFIEGLMRGSVKG
jgi:raffinose/stachyose/melibiose transport system permease protein